MEHYPDAPSEGCDKACPAMLGEVSRLGCLLMLGVVEGWAAMLGVVE